MKAPGYDLIGGKILKELPDAIITYIKNLFNGILRLQYFPITWKVGQIKAIPKPNKNANTVSPNRPIILLPVLSRVKFLHKTKNIIPPHQFGFRKQHSTVQHVHRVINNITDEFGKKKFCYAVYLNIAKAFDKVWHKGLLQKLRIIYKILSNIITPICQVPWLGLTIDSKLTWKQHILNNRMIIYE